MDEQLRQEFTEFKDSILEYVGGLKQWQAETVSYRKTLNGLVEKIFNKMEQLDKRCITREGQGCLVVQQHIAKGGEEAEYKRRRRDGWISQVGVYIICGLLGFIAKGLVGR